MLSPSRTAYLQGPPQPLMLSIPQPAADTFELFRRIARPDRPSFLLESGKGSRTVARYSFMGTDPYLVLIGARGRCALQRHDRRTVTTEDPFHVLTQLLFNSQIARPAGVPSFFGGAIGFFSYDLVRSFEAIPTLAQDVLALPELEFAFLELLVGLDHSTDTLHGLFCPPLERFLAEPREKLYREGCDRLAELEARLKSPAQPLESSSGPSRLEFTPDQPRQAYVERVRHCQEYIAAGDIYQANLSHRFTLESDQNKHRAVQQVSMCRNQVIPGLYQRLRAVNPSPFSALVTFDDVSLVSCSPERLVRLQDREVDTRPLAGTRPRGTTLSEDRRLIDELLANRKERAEHLMLVDLERNDLGRVCQFGTVLVDEFMAIEQYSHVNHLVSNVRGALRDHVTNVDLIKAVFPGGTISGVPKIRCMEIIEELEPVRRGPYTGSLGYLSWSGDLDLNILIRTLVFTKEQGYLQVGAGIVADSDPDHEYDETMYKAEAFFKALRES